MLYVSIILVLVYSNIEYMFKRLTTNKLYVIFCGFTKRSVSKLLLPNFLRVSNHPFSESVILLLCKIRTISSIIRLKVQ